jgi:hypothetical protein
MEAAGIGRERQRVSRKKRQKPKNSTAGLTPGARKELQKFLIQADQILTKAAKAQPWSPADAVADYRARLDAQLRQEYQTDPDPARRQFLTKAAGAQVPGQSAFKVITDPSDPAQWNWAFDHDHGLAGDRS